MEGVVVDVYKNYVKVKGPEGEKIVKIRGRGELPQRGWILELKRRAGDAPFVGSVVVDHTSILPPLKEAIPIIESTSSSDPYEIIFLSEMTRAVAFRLSFLPNWYYRTLGEYYKKGERDGGMMSPLTSKILKERKMEIRPQKGDRLRAFGRWLNTFSHPYRFYSKYEGSSRPTRIFMKKKSGSFMVRIDKMSKNHGRVIVEGQIGATSAKLKVVPENPISEKDLKDLKESLEKIIGEILIVQGGKGLGFYV